MEIINSFWANKKVFITGHTGFKGSWLSLWLKMLGAELTGLSLDPSSKPSLFDLLKLSDSINDLRGDVRCIKTCNNSLNDCKPNIIIHMAAQPLVRDSYINPVETFETNVLGTVNILEAAKNCDSVKSIIIVTSDKCYENIEKNYSYEESDKLGGHDPYSASKACAEIVTKSFRKSFLKDKFVGVASVRAGNVIGGGDWSKDRLLPDIIKAFSNNETLKIRNPLSVRPWQHVLEPLSGYLNLCEKIWNNPKKFSGSWNFGPDSNNNKNVKDVVNFVASKWGNRAKWIAEESYQMHEAHLLQLNSEKSKSKLGWKPILNWDEALSDTLAWYEAFSKNKNYVLDFTLNQILKYNGRKKYSSYFLKKLLKNS